MPKSKEIPQLSPFAWAMRSAVQEMVRTDPDYDKRKKLYQEIEEKRK